jgi:hypothetical protein
VIEAGVFLSVFLTFCVLSYLWRDNPFYKLAEHLFIGLSIGWFVTKQYWDVLQPTLVDRLLAQNDPVVGWYWYVIPAVLCLFVLARYWTRVEWLGRIPIALVVGIYAGQSAAAYARGVLVPQTAATIQSLTGGPAAADAVDLCLEEAVGIGADIVCRWGARVNALLIVLGVCSALLYFFYSASRERGLGAVSRVGLVFLMTAFGASFGFTVMGRVSLAIGRAQEVLAAPWASLASIVLVVVGLVVWSRWAKPSGGPS